MYNKSDDLERSKLKRILKVSDSIKMEQMRDMLDLDTKTFNTQILDWAEEFGFRIDGEFIIINKNTVDNFIDRLDKQFETWDKMETDKIGKLGELRSENYITSKPKEKTIRKEAEHKRKEEEERLKKIISFRGGQILQFEANILQMLETQLKKQFTLVNKIYYNTQMGFSVGNNKITGIGFYDCRISTLPESIGN
ncbi:hypothetical protein LCGC14_2139980, partial [marine sediment metagenome]